MWDSCVQQLAAVLLFSTLALASPYNVTARTLPATFAVPQVFENTNLVRNLNLEKSYVRETTNIVVKNVDKSPQSEYYFAFSRDVITKVGGLEARDKKNSELLSAELVRTDSPSLYVYDYLNDQF
jgi:oligosaccharyltransferase complex subunit alpha (ribophorin I)